jgi:hypothetical protein
LEPQTPERFEIYSFHGSDARLRKIVTFQALGLARLDGRKKLKTSPSKLFRNCTDEKLGERASKAILASGSAIFQDPLQKTPTHPRSSTLPEKMKGQKIKAGCDAS